MDCAVTVLYHLSHLSARDGDRKCFTGRYFKPFSCVGMVFSRDGGGCVESFMAIVSLSMGGAIKHLTVHRINFYLGLATVCYSVGQMIGPMVTVYAYEMFGIFKWGILVPVMVYGVALLVLLAALFTEYQHTKQTTQCAQ